MHVEKEEEKMLLVSSADAVVDPARVRAGSHPYGQ